MKFIISALVALATWMGFGLFALAFAPAAPTVAPTRTRVARGAKTRAGNARALLTRTARNADRRSRSQGTAARCGHAKQRTAAEARKASRGKSVHTLYREIASAFPGAGINARKRAQRGLGFTTQANNKTTYQRRAVGGCAHISCAFQPAAKLAAKVVARKGTSAARVSAATTRRLAALVEKRATLSRLHAWVAHQEGGHVSLVGVKRMEAFTRAIEGILA